MKEAAKLGFRQALAPAGIEPAGAMRVTGAARLAEAMARIGEGAWD